MRRLKRLAAAELLDDEAELQPGEEEEAGAPVDTGEPTPEERLYSWRLARAVLAAAKRARENVVDFFSFVMREEKTQRRIHAAPHQRLLYDFVEAHPRCVIRMPVGTSKTFSMAALTLFLLGNDPTERGAIISATQGQAAKPFSMVQDYLENEHDHYPELRLVFPELRPSHRAKDPWTQHRLVVERPPGIRDPSLVAIGVDGSLPGARLSWILVDDILNEDNTRTPAARAKVKRWFDSTVLSRKDIEKSRIVVCNTPWHPKDLTYALEEAGWPTLTMDLEGNITITNADGWDSDEIRPGFGAKMEGPYRLAAHDAGAYNVPLTFIGPDGRRLAANDNQGRSARVEPFDLDEVVPLWPEKYSVQKIADLREQYRLSMAEFYQLYLCKCRDDESARCKVEWVEQCKQLAVEAGYFTFVPEYNGPNLTVTGVDLAIGEGEEHDFTAYFTFEVIPELRVGSRVLRNVRRILDIEFGRFRGRAIVDKLIAKSRKYNSIVRVETNAAQDFIRQWTLDLDVSVPVRAHTTGVNKRHRSLGVEGLFIELENGAWLIPCDPGGYVPKEVEEWIKQCLYYEPPPAHTGDILMASWLARAQARELDFGNDNDGGSIAAAVGAR
jgi:hypothetical protein